MSAQFDEHFREVFQRLGPRFYLDRTLLDSERATEILKAEKRLQQDASTLLEVPASDDSPPLVFVESMAPIACALRHRGRNLIVFGTGTFLLLERYFNYAASIPELFSRFPGLHGMTQHEQEASPAPIPNTHTFSSFSPNWYPKSPARKSLAAQFLERALRFICAHEAAHIRLGHTNLSGGKWLVHGPIQGKAATSEVATELSRAMEVAADRHATASLIVTYVPIDLGLFPMFLLLSLFAMQSALRVFFTSPGWSNRLDQGSHPAAQVRSILVLSEAAAICEERELLDRSSFTLFAQDVFVEAHQCHARITGQDDWSQLGQDFEVFRAKSLEYVGRLLDLHDAWSSSV